VFTGMMLKSDAAALKLADPISSDSKAIEDQLPKHVGRQDVVAGDGRARRRWASARR
jgi:hypothetical protein